MPRREEARVLRRAGDLAAELGAELAEHGRDVDAHLLEHAAAHQRHGPAAAILAVRALLALPDLALEAAGRLVAMRALQLVLDPLELGADAVAQAAEPGTRPLPSGGRRSPRRAGARGRWGRWRCGWTWRSCESSNPEVWRRASLNTIAAARATLSDLAPACRGIRTRRSARSCTSGGTPALSRPISRMSSGRKNRLRQPLGPGRGQQDQPSRRPCPGRKPPTEACRTRVARS